MQHARGGSSSTRPPRRPGILSFSVAVAVAVVLAVAGVAVFAGGLGSPAFRSTLGNSLSAPLAALATAAAVAAAVRGRGRSRWGWGLIALGVGLWALGETVWLVREVGALQLGLEGVDDTLYLLGTVPVIAGTACFPGRSWRGADRLRAVLDAVTTGGAVLFLARGLGLFQPGGGTLAQQLVDLAYPAGDVIMLCVALMVALRAVRAWFLSLGLLVAALASYVVGDSVFALQTAAGTYVSGTPLDLTWNLSYLLLALAALAPGAPGREGSLPSPDDLSYRGRRAPWLLTGVVLSLMTVFGLVHPAALEDPVLVVVGAVVALTFALRQVWVFRDLSRLNSRLERQATRTEQMAEAVVDGVVVVDRDGLVVYANTAAGDLLQAPSADVTGQHITALLRDPDAAGALTDLSAAAVLDAMRTASSITQAAAVFQRADGSLMPVDVSVGPLGRSDPSGFVLVFRDASVRRAVDRMKNEFMSVISHELRTPLTSIRGALALLDGGVTGELPPQSSRMVGIALESSERLSRLINDILDVERLESGTLQLERGPAEAGVLVDAAVREMGGLAPAARVSVLTDPCLGTVDVDADRVVQVLTNLIGNAIKFSGPGDEVRVGAQPVGAGVEFWVRDQGRGVPAAKLGSIFDRFEQVDSSDSRQKGGTGLGLAICRDIVELHGGRIWAISELGAGAEFRFSLPAAGPRRLDAEPRGAEVVEPGPPDRQAAADPGGEREVSDRPAPVETPGRR